MSYPPQPPQSPQQPPQPPQGQYQQPYQQQPYPQQQYGQYQAPVQPKTHTLALTAFIMALACVVLVWVPKISLLAWLVNLTAFILGIVANGQIKRSAGALTGKGYAVAAIIISCVLFGILVLIAVAAVFVGAALLGGVMGGLK